jgi:hypothetical protein
MSRACISNPRNVARLKGTWGTRLKNQTPESRKQKNRQALAMNDPASLNRWAEVSDGDDSSMG